MCSYDLSRHLVAFVLLATQSHRIPSTAADLVPTSWLRDVVLPERSPTGGATARRSFLGTEATALRIRFIPALLIAQIPSTA